MDDCHLTALQHRMGAAGGTPPAGLFFPPGSSVHTLETNVGPKKPKKISTTKRDRDEARRDAAYEKRLRHEGWGAVLDGYEGPPATDSELDYRHGWWADDRAQVVKALQRCGFSQKRIDRFRECGGDCWVMAHKETGVRRLSANTCRDRACSPCSITRSNLIGGNLADKLHGRRWQKYLHVVLTLKSSNVPLAHDKRRLYNSFRKLRAFKMGTVPRNPKLRGRMVNWWSRYVRGGAAFFEPKMNADPKSASFGLWHCHLHLICESRWIPVEDLQSMWKCATGDSANVWIERIDDADAAAAEVSKYAAKGLGEVAALSPFKLDELLRTLNGTRLCFTFGSWRGFRLLETPDFDPNEWVTIGKLDDFLERARAGDDRAQHELQLLARPPP